MRAVRATRPMQPIRLLLFSGKVSSISFSYGVWEISEFLSGDLCRQAMKKIANTQESRIRHPSAARRTRPFRRRRAVCRDGWVRLVRSWTCAGPADMNACGSGSSPIRKRFCFVIPLGFEPKTHSLEGCYK